MTGITDVYVLVVSVPQLEPAEICLLASVFFVKIPVHSNVTSIFIGLPTKIPPMLFSSMI